MAAQSEVTSMAVFCDFENVALGVADAKYEKFDIKKVLERLLLKGSIVVKKAYCDWERYKGFKSAMHEAAFELIEIPHTRQAGKNSADIRLVVDALDLCYTKSHVDTFVIVSGDSDFSPLVSKLRENDKTVIGVGVKNSTSDLLIANCDEFIYYDDLVREQKRRTTGARGAAKAGTRAAGKTAAKAGARAPADKKEPAKQARRATEAAPPPTIPPPGAGGAEAVESLGAEEGAEPAVEEDRRAQAIEKVVETVEALAAERGDSEAIWGSMVKQTLKRREPGFNESYYGFRSFNALLEEARERGLLVITRDEKSGGYTVRPVTT